MLLKFIGGLIVEVFVDDLQFVILHVDHLLAAVRRVGQHHYYRKDGKRGASKSAILVLAIGQEQSEGLLVVIEDQEALHAPTCSRVALRRFNCSFRTLEH